MAAYLVNLPNTSAAAEQEEGRQGLLLVVNKGEQTLGIVDPDKGFQIATIDVGGKTGHEVAASSDGRTAWVPIYGDSGVGLPGSDGHKISVIDLVRHERLAAIEYPGVHTVRWSVSETEHCT
jgi:DNA-binding beta-propeller fold protein YncE